MLIHSKEAAGRILDKVAGQKNRVDRIYSKSMFKRDFQAVFGNRQSLTDTDMEVLLIFLARDKREIAYDGEVCIVSAVSRTLLILSRRSSSKVLNQGFRLSSHKIPLLHH